MIKIVFFGTPNYVVPILDKLHKKFKHLGESPIVAVVTQESKLVGRKQLKSFSPVDNWAYQHKRPIIFDPKEIINNNYKADIGVLASYGKIIPTEVIKHFKYGIINIHPSLLPLWRGASPIPASMVCGEKETGVTFMKLDGFLDHGPIISQFKDEILNSDSSETLKNRLFDRAGDVLINLIPAYINNRCHIASQDEGKTIYTRQLTKEDGHIPSKYIKSALEGKIVKAKWEITWIYKKLQTSRNPNIQIKEYFKIIPNAVNIFNFIRAMDPWPGAWTEIDINSKIKAQNSKLKLKSQNLKRLKIIKSHVEENKLVLDSVQLEGKSKVTWKQFVEGYPEAKFN